MHPENPKATVLQIDKYNHNSSIWYCTYLQYVLHFSVFFGSFQYFFPPRDPADLNFVKWFLFKKAAEANSLYT